MSADIFFIHYPKKQTCRKICFLKPNRLTGSFTVLGLFALFDFRQESVPYRTGNADRRIRARNNTDNQRKRKFLNRLHTQNIDRANGKQCCQGRIDRPCQRLADALIDFLRRVSRLERRFVFADTVKNYNSRIDRIPRSISFLLFIS